VTPQHTVQAAAILGPSKWLAVEQKDTLETDPAKARALGRKELSRYMPAELSQQLALSGLYRC